jgi:hypothetical protein
VGEGRLELAQQIFFKNHLIRNEAVCVDQCDTEDARFNLRDGGTEEQ